MFVEALFSLIQTDMVASHDTVSALSSANFINFILILTLRGKEAVDKTVSLQGPFSISSAFKRSLSARRVEVKPFVIISVISFHVKNTEQLFPVFQQEDLLFFFPYDSKLIYILNILLDNKIIYREMLVSTTVKLH